MPRATQLIMNATPTSNLHFIRFTSDLFGRTVTTGDYRREETKLPAIENSKSTVACQYSSRRYVYSDIRKPSFLWQRLQSCVSASPNARRPLWQMAQFCARELARCSTGEIELTCVLCGKPRSLRLWQAVQASRAPPA